MCTFMNANIKMKSLSLICDLVQIVCYGVAAVTGLF